MAIKWSPEFKKRKVQQDSIQVHNQDVNEVTKATLSNLNLDADSKKIIDQATALLHNIVTDKMNDAIPHTFPSEEQIRLLNLLEGIINASIDKHV